MATMNKPAAQSTNWTQDLTDNWTSIETNLVDKLIVGAKGELLAASGAGAPSPLAPGAQGRFLEADSAQALGLAWDPGGFTAQEQIDLLWGKKFFADEGLLPSTKIFEYVGTPPAFDVGGGVVGGTPWIREPGAVRVTGNSGGNYDFGAGKSKILIVVGNILKFVVGDTMAVWLSATPETTIPDNAIGMVTDGLPLGGSGPGLLVRKNGNTDMVAGTPGLDYRDYQCGYALYLDVADGSWTIFLRMGCQWFKGLTGGDADLDFTTLRYVCLQAGTDGQRFVTPFVCYAE